MAADEQAHDEQAHDEQDQQQQHTSLERRVHVDVPRVSPEDMVTTQQVDPPGDPEGGRNTDMEFMTRNAGW
jgi:hypothetical protein